MGQILDVLVDYCERSEYGVQTLPVQRPDIQVLTLTFQLDNGVFECFAEAREKSETFVFYSYMSGIVPEPKRMEVALYLTRANYGMSTGCFEMGLDDGRVRFRTSIDVENDRLTAALVENVVSPNLRIMDRYYPGIMAVIFGNRDAQDAIDEIEDNVHLAQS